MDPEPEGGGHFPRRWAYPDSDVLNHKSIVFNNGITQQVPAKRVQASLQFLSIRPRKIKGNRLTHAYIARIRKPQSSHRVANGSPLRVQDIFSRGDEDGDFHGTEIARREPP